MLRWSGGTTDNPTTTTTNTTPISPYVETCSVVDTLAVFFDRRWVRALDGQYWRPGDTITQMTFPGKCLTVRFVKQSPQKKGTYVLRWCQRNSHYLVNSHRVSRCPWSASGFGWSTLHTYQTGHASRLRITAPFFEPQSSLLGGSTDITSIQEQNQQTKACQRPAHVDWLNSWLPYMKLVRKLGHRLVRKRLLRTRTMIVKVIFAASISNGDWYLQVPYT